MKNLSLAVVILCISFSITSAQTRDSADSPDRIAQASRYYSYEYSHTKNKSWARNPKTITLENQGDYHSTYLAINNDSTFAFLSIFEGGEHLSVGFWTKQNDTTYCLAWNIGRTLELCNSKDLYEKYYKYSSPTPLKIEQWIFISRNSKLIPQIQSSTKKVLNIPLENGL